MWLDAAVAVMVRGSSMRRLLIAAVLGVTALTFYSAYRYKSVLIEADITKRVTEALAEKNAKDVTVLVDGRHVSLTGVVFDEATEKAHLATADQTYGALGPIDGLTYVSDNGHITAVKTSAGITLSGTVPTEELRKALLARADEATEGTVTDALTLSGPAADWQKEADFGLTSLAGLTEGSLSVAAGNFILSGSAPDDTGTVAKAVAEREGWQAFVSAPADLSGPLAEIERLKGVVSQSEATIGELTADRDAIAAELARLQAIPATDPSVSPEELSALQAELAAAQAELATTKTIVVEKEAMIASLTAGAAPAPEAPAAEAVPADLQNRVTELEKTIVDLETKVADGNTQIAALNDDLAKSAGDLASATDQNATLTATLAERDKTIAGFDSSAAPPASMAEICTARASAVIGSSRINFASGTAEIDPGSVDLLERITGITLACAGDGLIVEVGGHTDDRGGDEANQALSEARANAVVAFMAERGVPADTLKGIGFGEAQAIADNATAEGRAANRRISFNWLAR
jgi:OmpA-OmpF porin, OOP family